MLLTLIKKIMKNKWMYLCLLLGLVLSISIVVSIPMYSNASLARLLRRDLEDFKARTMIYPGAYTMTKTLSYYAENIGDVIPGKDEDLHPGSMQNEENKPEKFIPMFVPQNQDIRRTLYETVTNTLAKEFIPQIGLPVVEENRTISVYKLVIKENIDGPPVNKFTFGKLEAIKSVANHIKIISGRMYTNKVNIDGAYEVVVSQETMKTLNLILDKTYLVNQPYDNFLMKNKYFKVKIVGVYDIKDPSDPFWMDKWTTTSYRSMLIDDELFLNDLFNNKNDLVVSEIFWGYALDYTKINPENINKILTTLDTQKISEMRKKYGISPLMVVNEVLKTYNNKIVVVETILWIFQTPVLLILLIYIVMISNTIIRQDRNEILLLKSRGADKGQILKLYFFQAAIINFFALIIGIPLGKLLCRLISSSNGFLQFVNRKGLIISFKFEGYLYAALVTLVFICAVLISTMNISKESVVTDRQRRNRTNAKPLWQRLYIDVLSIGVSGYGLYTYSVRQNILSVINSKDTFIPVDPLLYIISTLFIIGLGLIFLRLYPYIIRSIFWFGRRIWSPAAYVSLLNVARSEASNQFIILFLILTISIGTFNLKSAGTINVNLENKTMYLSGADIVVTSKWESNIDSYPKNVQARLKDSAIYKQPDFSKYYSIAGVESAARVLTKKEASCIYGEAGKMVDGVYLMGIVPDEFGKTAHFDTNLLKIHWFNYLNAMTQYPNALLLSNSFKKQGIKEGDIVRVKWKKNGDEYADGFVAGFIDFWPSYNPNEAVMSSFIVGNLYYLQQRKLLDPYQVWLKQDGTVKTQEIYDDIINKIPNVTSIDFTNQKISNAKNDAVLQGTNGSLSLSFLSTIIITLIGFLIYWIFSIKGRIYQFSVFRSLGLTFKNVIRIIVYEQILISGAAIAIGAITGEITSRIFVPMIQMTSKTSDQILPFKIVAYMDDYIKLYAVVILMLISGFAILIRYASGIKMTQAIKLGED